jgi:hypothetical protein
MTFEETVRVHNTVGLVICYICTCCTIHYCPMTLYNTVLHLFLRDLSILLDVSMSFVFPPSNADKNENQSDKNITKEIWTRKTALQDFKEVLLEIISIKIKYSGFQSKILFSLSNPSE